jgi:hypothetical protein
MLKGDRQKLTEVVFPKRSATDILSKLELARDDMIHLPKRRIEKPLLLLNRRDLNTPSTNDTGPSGAG